MPAKNAKPVFLAGTNQTYPSIAAAAKALGVSPSSVSKVVSGKVPSVKGHRLGALSDRVISVPETGQIFASPVQAARQLGVKAKKVSSLLASGANQTTGGYHFEYDIAPQGATTQTRQAVAGTTISATAKPVKKGRKSNKQQRIKEKRQKKTAKAARQAEKAAARAADRRTSDARRRERDAERQQRYRKNEINRRIGKLRDLMEAINEQLRLYAIHEPGVLSMLEISGPAHQVMAYITELLDYNEYKENQLEMNEFDTSDENMEYLAEHLSDKEIAHYIRELTNETNKNDGLFWDIKRQEKDIDYYAKQFKVSFVEMAKYADLLPELWLIFREAGKMYEYKEYSNDIWEDIKRAVKGGIPREEFEDAIKDLEVYFEYGGYGVLDGILERLEQHYPQSDLAESEEEDENGNKVPF